MKKFILDYKTWRSGQNSKRVSTGKGDTELLNKEGYMCCLGQFCQQSGVGRSLLKGRGTPNNISNNLVQQARTTFLNKIPFFVDKEGYDTRLVDKALVINDSLVTKPAMKIFKLQKLFAKYGFQIVPQNMPSQIAKELRELRKGNKIIVKGPILSKSKTKL